MTEPQTDVAGPARARLIDGKALAARVRDQVARDVEALKARHGITPGLHVVIVGEHPPSQIYVRNKVRLATEVGMTSVRHDLDRDVSQDDLLALVARLNADEQVHGILVQLPLPAQIDEQAVIAAVDPLKDVDGFHVANAGALVTGGEGMVPCTPLGCLMMLKDELGDLTGLDAVVIGRSNIVGKPMAQLLLRENCTVTVAHSRTRDAADHCRRADIVVAAVGQAHLVTADWVKPGATVIDVGMNRLPDPDRAGKTRLTGDVDFEAVARVAGALTPVPGGVGPMTIACLLKNTVSATCRQAGITAPTRGGDGEADA